MLMSSPAKGLCFLSVSCVLAIGLASSPLVGEPPGSTAGRSVPEGSEADGQVRQARWLGDPARFPDVSTLRTWYARGRLAGSRAPVGSEADELQRVLDELNETWRDTRARQHALIEELAAQKIARGEAAILGDASFDGPAVRPAPGAVGSRLVVQGSVRLHVDVFPGESEELDRVTLEVEAVETAAWELIHAAFR